MGVAFAAVIMNRHLTLVLFAAMTVAACSGGSGGSSSASTSTTGAVHVVLDTATGSESLVQFQVGAAALEYADGTTTPNVLAEDRMVTFADPSGEVDGLLLRSVPSGEYRALHLMLVPGGGVVTHADGSTSSASGPVDLTLPINGGLSHSASGRSWLVIGHDAAPPASAPGALTWSPVMSGRVDGADVVVADLGVVALTSPSVVTTFERADGPMELAFADGCSFTDDDGDTFDDRGSFLASMHDSDELRVTGSLSRDGRCRTSSVRRSRGTDAPRLLGRITEIFAASSSFTMNVQAEVRRGERRLLLPPVDVLVRAATARIHRSDDHTVVAFADLAIGGLVKVKSASRTPVAGGPDEVVASEIEAPGAAVAMQPEWEGAVQSVDVAAGVIVVVPRHDDPIVIGGVVVAQVTVRTTATTRVIRRERNGGGESTIGLADIVPGADRIWWRGAVSGPSIVDASSVRVRAE